MVPSTVARVRLHTAAAVNERIEHETEERVAYFVDRKNEIPGRLDELDREWDIERMLETNASVLAFAGVVLATVHDRRWLLLSGAVTGFLFQHAIQGWCPPIPVLRRLGFRTASEIDTERVALKALRGDFARVAGTADASVRALEAARA